MIVIWTPVSPESLTLMCIYLPFIYFLRQMYKAGLVSLGLASCTTSCHTRAMEEVCPIQDSGVLGKPKKKPKPHVSIISSHGHLPILFPLPTMPWGPPCHTHTHTHILTHPTPMHVVNGLYEVKSQGMSLKISGWIWVTAVLWFWVPAAGATRTFRSPKSHRHSHFLSGQQVHD